MLVAGKLSSQELYVFSNPASNLPAKAIIAKVGFKTLQSYHNRERENRWMGEVQAGVHKNWMVSAGWTFSNMYFQNSQRMESIRFYSKYRFLSRDDVHRHFRMAAFSTVSWSRQPLVYHELSPEGDQSLGQVGLIATQLIKKTAVSGSVSVLSIWEKPEKIDLGFPFSTTVLQYSLSGGYLLFPFRYHSFRQLNVNLYTECIAQQSLQANTYFIDVAPALQFIVNSKARFNIGSRMQLAGNAHRMANHSVYASLEYNFLNVWK